MKIGRTAWLWRVVRPHSMVPVHGSSNVPAHKAVQTLAMAGRDGDNEIFSDRISCDPHPGKRDAELFDG
jgi:hypothetical protein